jgi:hypothetical protein
MICQVFEVGDSVSSRHLLGSVVHLLRICLLLCILIHSFMNPSTLVGSRACVAIDPK